jgi:hypothetical protein
LRLMLACFLGCVRACGSWVWKCLLRVCVRAEMDCTCTQCIRISACKREEGGYNLCVPTRTRTRIRARILLSCVCVRAVVQCACACGSWLCACGDDIMWIVIGAQIELYLACMLLGRACHALLGRACHAVLGRACVDVDASCAMADVLCSHIYTRAHACMSAHTHVRLPIHIPVHTHVYLCRCGFSCLWLPWHLSFNRQSRSKVGVQV